MADKSKYGSFVATTNVYDIEEDLQTVLVRLRQTINDLALSSNTKDTGYYVLEEFLNGQRWFEDPALNSTTAKSPIPRQVYRKVINFGALPNNTTKSVAHGLTIGSSWTFTRIYGTASDTSANTYVSIPYSVTTGSGTGTVNLTAVTWAASSAPVTTTTTTDAISIDVDATNVNITTTTDKTAYTACYVILEYIKE